MCVGVKPQPPIKPHLLDRFLSTGAFYKHPVSGNHYASPIRSRTAVDINRLRLLIDNREEMRDVVVCNRWFENYERLPIPYTKVTHVVVASVPDNGLIKGVPVIKE